MKFSIVVPVYNRAKLVQRALRSCFAQTGDFEVIVVDDGSADGSVAAVKAISDPRLTLIVHEQNRGVGPARNTGVAAARGEWIVCLDSDDELLPGAIEAMDKRAGETGDTAEGMRFMVRFDSGELSPEPPLDGSVWDYEGYVRWMEASFGKRQETLPVVRRRTFDTVRYSENRALESLYHLDFAKSFRIYAAPDVVRLYHHDADNQLTRPGSEELMKSAADQAAQTETLLARHGDALARWAPRRWRQLMSGLSTMHFLAGNRLAGMRAAAASLRVQPLSARQWAVLVAGLAGRRPLARLRSMRGGS